MPHGKFLRVTRPAGYRNATHLLCIYIADNGFISCSMSLYLPKHACHIARSFPIYRQMSSWGLCVARIETSVMSLLRDQALVSISCQWQKQSPISLTTDPQPGPDLSYLRKLTSNSLLSFVWASVTQAGAAIYKLRARPAKAEELRIAERKHILSLMLRDVSFFPASTCNSWPFPLTIWV